MQVQALLLPNLEKDAEGINGGEPFGVGLKEWMKNSPLFRAEKISAPLRIEASEGPISLILMLEPYHLLSYMHKPVELIYYSRTGTHPLTNPAQRLEPQGGSVDWFRFWLQSYEDPEHRAADSQHSTTRSGRRS
jgi:hypothetical protein